MMFDGLPQHHFGVIVADPGTAFDARSVKGETTRSPQRKYRTLPDADIAALPVGNLGSRDSFLFYWDTTARIAAGRHIPIMQAWGYRPTAFAFTWVKLQRSEKAVPFFYPRGGVFVGMGFTTRKNTEVCILGRRGSPKRLSKRVFEVIFAPRREHSRKPDEFYDRVRAFAAGPYLELFSREQRRGWTCRGDQVDRFTESSRLPTQQAAE